MSNFLYLAHEGGWGLNFNILETNLINLAILVGLLLYYGPQLIGKILSERRAKIEGEIKEAEKRAADAAAALADAQQKLARAQAEAEKIRAQAEETAKNAKEQILAQGKIEVERMRAGADRDTQTEQDRAIAELKQRVAQLAIERVESRLQEILDDSAQTQLIDRSIAQLRGR
ncbi:MAG: F0F1 ATP synthase subunit B [Cyanobacteriota bacterium]|nr:F0F1 ATP synthase subunit B [Cyanobacteriota bacterium]